MPSRHSAEDLQTLRAYQLLAGAAIRFGIQRTIELFRILPAHLEGRGGVRRVSTMLSTSAAMVHRFLRPLEELGAVTRVDRGVYTVDVEALDIVRSNIFAILGLSVNGNNGNA